MRWDIWIDPAIHSCKILILTAAEAKKILKELKAGKRFATRFQEQEWGLYYSDGDDRYIEWGREADLSGRGKDRSFENRLSEDEAIGLLKQYSYNRTRGGMR